MRSSIRFAFLVPLGLVALAGAAEKQQVGDRQVPVSNKEEITLRARNDADVQARELYYARYDGDGWGEWQKHGLSFGRDNAITWTPPEGHWRVYVRIVEISGLAMPVPDAQTTGSAEFIIDRSAPSVAVTFPGEGEKLRGNDSYTIRWDASDPHLAGQPVTISWSRSGEEFTPIATGIANTGSYDWRTPRNMTTTGVVRVAVADKAGNIGSDQAGSLMVDSILPTASVTGPGIVADQSVAIEMEAEDQGPAGMRSVQVWLSGDAGQTWSEGPVINEAPFTSTEWQAPADGSYLLRAVAVDQAGNGGAQPQPGSDSGFTVIVDTVAPVVTLPTAIGINEADQAQATARRAFKPGDRVAVSFVVKDANIAANSAAIYLQTGPEQPWQLLAAEQPVDAAFRFAIPDTSTRQARIKVQATDIAGNLGEVVARETFVIDNTVEQGAVEVDL